MGSHNSYLKNNVPAIYRKSQLDLMIYVFIDAQKRLIASLSIEESAKAFMLHYDIPEEEYSLKAVLSSFLRTRKELFDEARTDKKTS